MANRSQFEEFDEPAGSERRSGNCAVCETMLPDAVDGLLTEAEQLAFDKHVASCAECARELADARRGAAWLGMLKSKAPEPPAGLLAKILSGTTDAVENNANAPVPTVTAPSVSIPDTIAHPGWNLGTRVATAMPRAGFSSRLAAIRSQLGDVFSIDIARTTFHPRLAMTAAMAFFSIALTLNLTGVRLRDLRASNFAPSSLMRTMANAEASATRLFQNNREVYQVESRLSELRSDDTPETVSPDGHR